jgi:hypothetical protein
MTVLSRMAKLAIAAETVPGTYQPPAFTVVFSRARYKQHITPLRDTACRGSDSAEQDLLQGPAWSEWVIPSDLYPDLVGWYLAAMIGPDDCTPGVTTTFAAAASPGAASISLDAAPAAGAVLMLGSGDTLEYAEIGTPTGSGPYSCPVVLPASGLLYAHDSGDAAASQATHVFSQQGAGGVFAWPMFSLTMDDGTGPLGWPGCVFGSLAINLSKDGTGSLQASCSGFPPAAQDTFTYDASPAQPMQGWQWVITQDGTASTRGLSMALTLTRALQVQPCINGQQAPLIIWPGPLKADGSYSAIFEDDSDLGLYVSGAQQSCVHTVTQPVLAGGCSLSLTMPRSGWWDGEASQEDVYLSARFSLSGIADPPGGAAFTATLVNFWQSAYA